MRHIIKLIILFVAIFFVYDSQAQNVGINTTTPAYPLDVNGRMRLQHYNGASAGLWFNDSKNKESHFIGMFNDTVSGLYGSGWKIGMDGNNGRIGIGTMLPTAPLSFANNLDKKISLYHGTTGDAGFGVFGNELRIHSDYVNAATTFGYDDYKKGFTENMRLTGNGNLGIGTNNPTAKLDVAGNVRIADGTQGAGKILTSDANGNASWKAQSNGITERFMYRLFLTDENYPNSVVSTDYNFGTTTFRQEGAGNTLIISFPKGGLYHLDISISRQHQGNYSATGNPKILNLIVDNSIGPLGEGKVYNQSFAPYEYYEAIGYSQVSINKSIDVYISPNTSIRFYLGGFTSSNFDARLIVIGHLISE